MSSWGGTVTWQDYKSLIELYKAKKNADKKWKHSDPVPYPKLIFTTPEKLANSDNFVTFL